MSYKADRWKPVQDDPKRAGALVTIVGAILALLLWAILRSVLTRSLLAALVAIDM